VRTWPRTRDAGRHDDQGRGGQVRSDRDGPVVVHARVLDGEHLTLAVRGQAAELVLRTTAGDTPLTTEPGADRHGPLSTATVALDPHVVGLDPRVESVLEVLHSTGGAPASLGTREDWVDQPATGEEPSGPGLHTPITPDGAALWEVRAGPGLVLVRRPAPPGVPVLGLRGTGPDTEVLLGPGPTDRVELRRQARITGHLALEPASDTGSGGGRLLRLGRLLAVHDGDVPRGTLHADGRPLTRARSHLSRPQRAVELPPLPPGCAMELRWNPSGQLVLRPSRDPGPSGPGGA